MTATIRDLVYMVESIPEGSTWTATGLGKNAWHIAAATISLGGHVRVGFEDNLYMEKGVLAESNGQMVAKVVELAKTAGQRGSNPCRSQRDLRTCSAQIVLNEKGIQDYRMGTRIENKST